MALKTPSCNPLFFIPMYNSERNRNIYNALKKELEQYGIVPTPAILRQSVVITNTKDNYIFEFNKDTDTGADINLKREDDFVITDLGVYLLREPTAEAGTGVLQTYVNATNFPAASGFSPEDLNVFYNGTLETRRDKQTDYEKFPTLAFQFIPQFQQSASTNKSQKNAFDGVVSLDPLVRFKGNAKNKITITVPIFGGIEVASVTAGVDHKLVVIPYGYLISGLNK